MQYGIQRRGIFLAPPSNADLDWLFTCFERPEIWESFAFDRNGRMVMLRKFRDGDLVVGILHRVKPRKRIGFVIMFPPDVDRDYWEFSYAVPEPSDRDAFSALSATDAMAHYMFDHLDVLAMGWRAWEDNRAARAVIARLGYQPNGERWVGNRRQIMYRLSREGWAARRAKLERGELEHPSGTGSVFIALREHPWSPVELSEAGAALVDQSRPAEAPKERTAVVASKGMGKKKEAEGPPKTSEGLAVVPANDSDIDVSLQAMARRDVYGPLGWDRSAPVLFQRALRKNEVELLAITLAPEGPWIGMVIVVPPKSSTFRVWELDIAIVRLKEQTHERRVEATRRAVETFFKAHPDALEVIIPLPASGAVLFEAAEEAGLARVPDEELSPLPFRRALDVVAYRAKRA
ncbi:MAG: GNAT family N-acetyltransferase [Deltaproteobacteria bacterium]|nr:GNAT family N-acetyltransferase [Deltaproteobacteria bacterium]